MLFFLFIREKAVHDLLTRGQQTLILIFSFTDITHTLQRNIEKDILPYCVPALTKVWTIIFDAGLLVPLFLALSLIFRLVFNCLQACL